MCNDLQTLIMVNWNSLKMLQNEVKKGTKLKDVTVVTVGISIL